MGRAFWFRIAAAGTLASGAPAAHAQRLADVRPAVAPASAAPDGGGPSTAWHVAAADTTPPARPAQPADRRAAHARRGALIGAALGVGVALFMNAQLAEPGARTSNARQTWAAVAVCGAVGAAVGGVVGALIR